MSFNMLARPGRIQLPRFNTSFGMLGEHLNIHSYGSGASFAFDLPAALALFRIAKNKNLERSLHLV
jgi:hypothetical protein